MTSLSIFNLFYCKDTEPTESFSTISTHVFQDSAESPDIGIIIMSDSPLGILCPVDVDCLASGGCICPHLRTGYLRSDNHLDHMEHSWNTVK